MVGSDLAGIRHAACFSFFATKNMTSAEGGLVTTSDADLLREMERLRAHGIVPLADAPRASGYYDVTSIGFNFHLSDVNIVLGIEQLKRLDEMNATRKAHAAQLSDLLADVEGLRLPVAHRDHVFHLYNVLIEEDRLSCSRDDFVRALLAEGIGVGLYYRPMHLFTHFRSRYGSAEGMLPITEGIGARIVTLPMYPALTGPDIEDIATALRKVVNHYRA